jgi:glucosamine--fructose-6-phosphate aminotransferase (isomerizing)
MSIACFRPRAKPERMSGPLYNPPQGAQPGPTKGSPAMLREIYEQPHALRETVHRHIENAQIFPAELRPVESALRLCNRIIIAASGSSRHAGLAGEIMIEDLAGVAVDVEYASEYALRSTHAGGNPLVAVITQSGETADTIAALREALERGAKAVAVSNVVDSTISREATAALITHAAPETAVPATKSFTAQLAILYLLALFLARERDRMSVEAVRSHVKSLEALPSEIERKLGVWDSQSAEAANCVRNAKTFLFLGRGIHYAIAREGALKLKEVSYVQAEGMPAGELRHGPNALVDEKLVVVALATHDSSDSGSALRYRKTLGVLEYVKNCGGRVIAIATEGDGEIARLVDRAIFVPAAPELLLPILEVVPLQLFAYHFATINGCDVDHPRHLVKAVTRE